MVNYLSCLNQSQIFCGSLKRNAVAGFIKEILISLCSIKTSMKQGPGLFEPIHGSAPDIAGQVTFSLQNKKGFYFIKFYLKEKEKGRT